jgi:hypothetical protein
MRAHQDVDMIWHNHERVERITIAVEMTQRVGNRCRNPRLAKDAFAMALIEPLLTRILKSRLILVLRRSVPGFRMEFSPSFQFFFPLPKQFLRNRVGQTEGNEICCILLFPMRETASGLSNWCVWVDATKF